MKTIQKILIIFASFSSIAYADIDKGKEAYFMGDYIRAHKEFMSDAMNDNSYAQIKIAFMYENGWGVPKNYEAAKSWYEKAAKLNDPEAHVALGKLFAYGKGVTKSQALAEQHLQNAVNLGFYHAYYVLGDIHNDIFALGNNGEDALKWYLLAAEHNAAAYLRNGHFRKGRGQWFRLLTEEGVKLTVEAADKGNVYAQLNLGLRYYFGDGAARDYEIAGKYFLMAAEAGISEAQNYMGQNTVVLNPNGHDKVLADMWFTIALKNGFNDGLNNKHKIELNMTEDEIDDANIRAENWLESH